MNKNKARIKALTKIKKFEKLAIARSLLGSAIKLYEEGDYFACLHVAGASEEILGRYLKIKGQSTSLDSNVEAFIKIHALFLNNDKITKKYAINFLNKPKNSIKHLDGKEDYFAYLDPQTDAGDMLVRAFINMWRLDEDLTPLMEKIWTDIEGGRHNAQLE